MAVDEAILETVGCGKAPPTLRLYAWEPPCLSLGYAQRAADVDLEALRLRGWDLVRRPTGGRAILHTDELTYAVIAPHDEPRVAGSILDSYQRLALALLEALELLQVPAHTEEKNTLPERHNPIGPVCFEVPSSWEITIDGKKLIGSAQVRRRIGILQHGSLPLYGDLSRITQVLTFSDVASRADAAQRLLQRATTVETARQQPILWEEAAGAFEKAFEQTLKLKLEPTGLTPAEKHRANELVETKYGTPAWNERI